MIPKMLPLPDLPDLLPFDYQNKIQVVVSYFTEIGLTT